jgi:putative membrane protein
MKLLLRWIVTGLALFVAQWLVPGITVDDARGWVVYAIMAVVLGLVNAIIRPLLKLLTCPLIVLTLGLFVLVINALTLWLSSYIAAEWLNVGFYVDNFWAALLGSVVVSVVSVIANSLLKDDDEDDRRRNR